MTPFRPDRPMLVLLASLFVVMVGYGSTLTVLPDHIQQVRGMGAAAESAAFHVGMVVGVYALAGLLASTVVGRVGDRRGRRPLLLAGLGGLAATQILFGLSTSLWMLYLLRMLGGFGILAAVLATAALTGLISLVVTLRRRELAIRAALGATPGRLRWHVLAEAAWLVAVATGTGLLVAILAGRLIGAMLVDVSPHDPSSLAAAALLTVLSGLFGCAWPAKRAARDDAVNALRE